MYDIMTVSQQAQLLAEFNRLKKEVFEGLWKVRFNSLSELEASDIQSLKTRAASYDITSWRTINWMAEQLKRREKFEFLEHSHITGVYKIVMGYLRCIHDYSSLSLSMNQSFSFPVQDIVALDDLSVYCFTKISNVFGMEAAGKLEDDEVFAGYGFISKQTIDLDYDAIAESRKTVGRPDYLSVILNKAK